MPVPPFLPHVWLIPALGLALTGCTTPPQGPDLLSRAEITAATQGTNAQPDNAPLQARAAGLSARADALRRGSQRATTDTERVRRLRAAQREAELAAL